jgi:hypothetical protein
MDSRACPVESEDCAIPAVNRLPPDSANPFEPHGLVRGMRLVLFILVGAALGFGWHRFVGCRTGACAITANPYTSTIYGAAMGFMLGRG